MDGLLSGFGDLLSGLGRLTSGLGDFIGTGTFGTVGDWVGGVIAAVALVVAVGTQRRQQTQEQSAQSVQLRVKIKSFLIKDRMMRKYLIHIENTSEKPFRNVMIIADPSSGKRTVRRRRIKPKLANTPWVASHVYPASKDVRLVIRMGTIKAGADRMTYVEIPDGLRTDLFIRYEDNRAVEWKYDLHQEERSKMR